MRKITLLAMLALVAWAPTAGQNPQLTDLSCCDPEDQPGISGQFCAEGVTCCASGHWQCNDAAGDSTCALDGELCRSCCDPLAEPGSGDNPPCVEGASCCSSGEWTCNAAGGASICAEDGVVCRALCCDPLDEPGANDNPPCIEGASCCASGDWICNDATGNATCSAPGLVCEGCCDPFEQPGSFGNPPCFEGAGCCADGEWHCNDGAGQATCEVDGRICDRCCDPLAEPGAYDNPPCVEGATCCASGEWQCNNGAGHSTCSDDGEACRLLCCDPREEPGEHGNPPCFEGASCCSTGEWQCNDPTGLSTCDLYGFVCEQCCDPNGPPLGPADPPCIEGATCCADGQWNCDGADGSSTCHIDGLACEQCCDSAEEPGQFGNPPCIEGATCCASGEWQCNDGSAQSTCDLDGAVCAPLCCEAEDRPNETGNPYCATGFHCCADGLWRCNTEDGLPTCPGEISEECPRVCGGIAGIPCEEGEFCKLREGDCCCDFLGYCVEIPQGCFDLWDPVCGCDGETYGNECEADRAGVSVLHRGPCQQVCGGIQGIECPEGEFCLFPEGECCCDIEGVCSPIPRGCPAIWDPVCGCDRRTYQNECMAYAAGVSIDYPGTCDLGRLLVRNVTIDRASTMHWSGVERALAYNVYRKIVTARPLDDYGTCLYSGISSPQAPLPGVPRPGEPWFLQVTALFRHGEGPMGISSDFKLREPAAPCTCTLPSDVGPCDAAIPRWFHDFSATQCEMFVYGGCEGNANNFEKLEECNATCTDTCVLAPETGPCEALIPRWFYSADTGRCEPFIYGGCQGNANNFESLERCRDTCP